MLLCFFLKCLPILELTTVLLQNQLKGSEGAAIFFPFYRILQRTIVLPKWNLFVYPSCDAKNKLIPD